MNTPLSVGDALPVDQSYVDWHTKYHNLKCGLRLHNGQKTRQPVLGERLSINCFWLAEGHPIEACSEDGFIFRMSFGDAQRMLKADLVSRGAVFYGDVMMKPPKEDR